MEILALPSIWFVLKIFFIVGLLVYLIFALVVVRQVRIMNETLDVGFEGVLSLLSYLHLFFAIGVLAFALLIL